MTLGVELDPLHGYVPFVSRSLATIARGRRAERPIQSFVLGLCLLFVQHLLEALEAIKLLLQQLHLRTWLQTGHTQRPELKAEP